MDQFIQQLLADAGVSDSIDAETRAQLTEDLVSRATDFVNRRLVEAMPEDVLPMFESLIDQPDTKPEAVQAFVDQHVPNKEAIIGQALLEFRALYLGQKA